MPVPDQVRDDGSGIHNLLKLLDSGFRRNDKKLNFGLFTISSNLGFYALLLEPYFKKY